MTVEERFESKIEKQSNGCWLWQACVNSTGYGCFCFNNKWAMAHRVSWEMKNGSIPEGMQVCHTCDIPSCVNPEHLFLGSRSDNMINCVEKKRQNYAKRTKCSNGHILDGNYYVRRDCVVSGRRCKTCHSKQAARYRAKRKSNG